MRYPYNNYPLNQLDIFDQHHICTMIKLESLTGDLQIKGVNIFYFLLEKQYYVAFEHLYKKAKEEDSNFKLNDIHIAHRLNLLGYYFQTKPKDSLNTTILSIFVEEKLTIADEADSRLIQAIIDGCPDNDLLTTAVTLLEPLFPEKYKQGIQIPVVAEESKRPLVQWYNSIQMASQLAKSSGSNAKVLTKIINEIPDHKPLLVVEDESFFEKLEEELPNFKEVIDYYKGQFRQNYYSNKKRINPILLLGDPGIGKTYFSKKLASYLNTGYSFIDMGSLTSSWVLSGNNGSWQDAKQGKILDLMMKSPTFNPIVLLDELDKTSRGNHDPQAILYQLLEEINARDFTDEYIDVSIDVSGIIYIACANSLQTLSDPLLSRFKVFTVPSPTSDQLDLIIKNIYREAIGNNPLLSPELEQNLVGFLKNNSLREVKIILEEAITNMLLEYTRDQLNKFASNKQTLSLEKKHFRVKQEKTKIGF